MSIHFSKSTSKVCVVKLKMLNCLVWAPVILLILNNGHQIDAIFNCFTPNMFKMGKLGHPMNPYVHTVGNGFNSDRNNWYPQQAYQQQYAYNSGAQNPMK